MATASDEENKVDMTRRATRWVVVGVLVLAALLAFGVRGLLADRVVQARAVAMIRAGNFAQALEEADLRLSHDPDDPHLRDVAVLAARSHVDSLLEHKTPVADVAAWLEDQLRRRPYLRPALGARLAELQAEARRTARLPEKN
ncbi:MAG TPA: hypothetical protein VFI53_03780 [Myxococcaceae bacterium]|nr:hypothetical protein [Myxococcaceae bacterium]